MIADRVMKGEMRDDFLTARAASSSKAKSKIVHGRASARPIAQTDCLMRSSPSATGCQMIQTATMAASKSGPRLIHSRRSTQAKVVKSADAAATTSRTKNVAHHESGFIAAKATRSIQTGVARDTPKK